MSGGTAYRGGPTAEDEQMDAKQVRGQKARQYVRAIRSEALLTPEWFALCEDLEQLSRIANFELASPAVSGNVADMKGRVAGEGTLWDQAHAEDAIRILVEEAKVSLCVRLLAELRREAVHNVGGRLALVKKAAQENGVSDVAVENRLAVFEEALGFILCRTLRHVEALQLTDCGELADHCAAVLQHTTVAQTGGRISRKNQEVFVLYYVHCLCAFLDKLNGQQILSKMCDGKTIPMLLQHVLDNRTALPAEAVREAIFGLSALAENEDFQTRSQEFFNAPVLSAEERQVVLANFARLETEVVRPFVDETPDLRPAVRPLLDFLNRVKRGK